jgi:hypothetical protein
MWVIGVVSVIYISWFMSREQHLSVGVVTHNLYVSKVMSHCRSLSVYGLVFLYR